MTHNPAHSSEVLKVAFLEEMGITIQKLAYRLAYSKIRIYCQIIFYLFLIFFCIF